MKPSLPPPGKRPAKARSSKATPSRQAPPSVTAGSPAQRVQKMLAVAGEGSRREMEAAIVQGRVRINRRLAQLGDQVSPGDQIELDNRLIRWPNQPVRRVLLYNKPEGEICSRKDPQGRSTVFDQLPVVPGERWVAIGRLDINTSGLLLFTTDGELAQRLMHPAYGIDREYAVRVCGEVSTEQCNRLLQGVTLDDGPARFSDIQYFNGRGLNHWYHVVLMEGRNREVRRLWASQGVSVSRLKRVRYGPIFLQSDLRTGQWKELDKVTINQLAQRVDLPPAPWQALKLPDRHAQQRLQRKGHQFIRAL